MAQIRKIPGRKRCFISMATTETTASTASIPYLIRSARTRFHAWWSDLSAVEIGAGLT
jgi:hypothetical protein